MQWRGPESPVVVVELWQTLTSCTAATGVCCKVKVNALINRTNHLGCCPQVSVLLLDISCSGVLTRYRRSACDGPCLDTSAPPITTHSTFHSLTKESRLDGESGRKKTTKKDRFQYQPVICLLRLDSATPCRHPPRNLPLMKYDICANGVPPPIQQSVITFQNKYTKRLLKNKTEKKKRGSCFPSLSPCKVGWVIGVPPL